MWRLLLLLCSSLLFVSTVFAKDNVYRQRGVLAEMQSISCGYQQKSGSTVAGVLITGAQHTKSRELLCQEYILKGDRVTYRIRPTEEKHPVLLPVGETAEFRLKKDKMLLRVPESDNKEREYIVVSMTPSEEFAATINKTQRPPKPHVNAAEQPEQPTADERAAAAAAESSWPQTAPATNQSPNLAEKSAPGGPAQAQAMKTSGLVQVDSSPTGAEIFVDSTPAGRTPNQIEVSAGSHALQVVMPGYKDWVQTIDVRAGTQQRVTASLVK